MIKYDIGTIINKKWVIISILKVNKQNKKVICYNIENNIFKEGWIWDFTRDLVKLIPNKKPECYLSKCLINQTGSQLADIQFDYAYDVYFNCNYLSRDEYSYLRDIREGSYAGVNHLLKTFDWLLYSSGQARRNSRLAMLIGTTYKILIERGIIK